MSPRSVPQDAGRGSGCSVPLYDPLLPADPPPVAQAQIGAGLAWFYLGLGAVVLLTSIGGLVEHERHALVPLALAVSWIALGSLRLVQRRRQQGNDGDVESGGSDSTR